MGRPSGSSGGGLECPLSTCFENDGPDSRPTKKDAKFLPGKTGKRRGCPMQHALQGVLILIAAGVSAAFVPSPAPVLGRRIHLSGRPVRSGLCCADASHATEAAACSGPPASQFWEWRYNSRIHYTQAGDTGPPIVLLTGFGVGGFHYARNIEVLGKAHRVWTMDILGQGQSWPQVSLSGIHPLTN